MPLAFVSSVLAAEGALVEEVDPRAAQVILPEGLRVELDLPEAPLLATDGRDGSVACGHGTELFQALVRRALRGPPVAVAEALLAAPRLRDPDAYAGLNVALRPGASTAGSAWTLTAHLRVEAVADERRLSRVACAVSLADGCPIEPPAWDAFDLRELAPSLGSDAVGLPDDASLALAQEGLLRDAAARALDVVAPFRAHVARRLRRDLLRVEGYFAELDADLATRAARSRAPEALAAKRAALPAERTRRLANLRESAALKVEVTPAALVLVRHPVLEAPLEVLRRKARRTITVRYHAALRRWTPIACEGCGAATTAFGACDDAVHVLCAACLEAGGERQCPRCRRGAPPRAERRLELTGLEEDAPTTAPHRAPSATSSPGSSGQSPGRATGNGRRSPPSTPSVPSPSAPSRGPKRPAAPRPSPTPPASRPDPALEAWERARAASGSRSPIVLLMEAFAAGKREAEESARRRAERAKKKALNAERAKARSAERPDDATNFRRGKDADRATDAKRDARRPDDERQSLLWSDGVTPADDASPVAPDAPSNAAPRLDTPARRPPTGVPAASSAPSPRAHPRPPAATGPLARVLPAVVKVLTSTREPLTATDVAMRADLSAELTRAALATLVAHGAVQRTGRTRGTRYSWTGW